VAQGFGKAGLAPENRQAKSKKVAIPKKSAFRAVLKNCRVSPYDLAWTSKVKFGAAAESKPPKGVISW
jgi:hypothetical protein